MAAVSEVRLLPLDKDSTMRYLPHPHIGLRGLPKIAKGTRSVRRNATKTVKHRLVCIRCDTPDDRGSSEMIGQLYSNHS